jgi:bifunctional non-homologous end joining protein LigD
MPARLSQYRRKRDFTATPEPRGAPVRARLRRGKSAAQFVVHLHHARTRHFDLRLQVGDVLRSWAVPKGPSLDPRTKRLAVEVEEHPLAYGRFEGRIPQGQYGAGDVSIWDRGEWSPAGDPVRALKAGRLHFTLQGQRLHGAWSLVRTRLKGRQPQWLLIKSRDAAAQAGDEADDTPLSAWRANGGANAAAVRSRVAARRAEASATGRRGTARRAARSATRTSSGTTATGPLPAHVGLQLARLVSAAPAGDEWLHEVKFDGYRILAWRDGSRVRITSRGNQDWTQKLAATARAVGQLPCRSCILDGELVTLDREGRSNFGLLQQRFGEAGGEAHLRAMVFDLLWLDGKDLRGRPEIERKHELATLMKGAAPPLHPSAYVLGNGARAAAEACARGLEGIVSKSVSAPYQDGRGGAWLKIKCVQSDEYAVIGYTTGKGARAALGSLLLATPTAAGGWRYRGRVGTGLDERLIAELLGRLSKARSAQPNALEGAPTRAQLRGATPLWVSPQVVVEVEFRGYTQDGLLRQASLKGVREDRSIDSLRPAGRDSAQVGTRSTVPAARESGPRLTHPERVLFTDPTITKQQLADFYRGIADFILPGLINRPLMLLRCPQGAGGKCFFQKHVTRALPPQLREVNDPAAKQRWLYVENLDGLVALVQVNALEYHVWGCTVNDLDRADRLVIDLDPGAGVPWRRVTEAAVDLRERLAKLALECFVRTSGGKGLHVVIPVRPAVAWDSASSFARALVETMAREHPDRYLAVAAKAQRRGRIFLDYLRNARGATAVCSYSLRNRAGAPLAAPLTWDELPRVRAADQFRYANIGRRLQRLSADPWADIDRLRQTLPPVKD